MPNGINLESKIEEQLLKLENDADITSASNYWVAQRWESWNFKLGFSTVGVSGLVTVIGSIASIEFLKDYHEYINVATTILASIATVIGSILTFLKPSERGSLYREFGGKQKELRNKIRVYRTVEILLIDGIEEKKNSLVSFLNEKENLNADNPPIPRKAFQNASSDIKEKKNRQKVV